MSHNRKYVPSSIDLVAGNLGINHVKLIEQDCIEQLLIDSNFFNNAPFKWIGLIYRYGLKNMLVPEYQRISKKHNYLPIAIEIKMEILEWANKNNLKLLYDIFMIGVLDALINVGKKYGLPTHILEKERANYDHIPETIDECMKYEPSTIEDYKFLKQQCKMEINLCSNCGRAKETGAAWRCIHCGQFHEPQLI